MVVTLSPSKANFEETVTTLRFAERLKAVVCQPQPKPVVEVPKEKYTEDQFEALQLQVNRLQETLERSKAKCEALVERDRALVDENNKLRIQFQAVKNLLEQERMKNTSPSKQTQQCVDAAMAKLLEQIWHEESKVIYNMVHAQHQNELHQLQPSLPEKLQEPKPIPSDDNLQLECTILPPLNTTRPPEPCLPQNLLRLLVHVPPPMRELRHVRPHFKKTKPTSTCTRVEPPVKWQGKSEDTTSPKLVPLTYDKPMPLQLK
ncbi:hypothetical protein AC1031_006291 [Aphanomyces cochlioides]|nr:hypothetical protein AC1031_006291 [Aphanomyces cochlioides]